MAGDRNPRRSGGANVAPGSVIADKYVVDEILGTGAMGFVVSATHKLIGQRVAIKLIKADYVESPEALARFKREARALVAVQSENVVRVFDYGTLPDASPYLVMEYLTGRDLQEELRLRDSLPLEEAAEIVLQACEGLAAAHALGIVHRDVKPANLFLSRRANGKLVVKIVDFGISKAPRATEEELTTTRGSIGSPHYMSPEQLRSASRVDARSDVWSLGVTLFRALTGELPFSGESVGALLASVVSEEPRRLREARPDLPQEMEDIVARCLEKNPEDRFAGAQELADALAPFAMPIDRSRISGPERVADPSPVPPPPSSHGSTSRAHIVVPLPEARGPLRDWRPRASLAAAIAVPLALVAVALKVTPPPRSAAPAALPEEAPVVAMTDRALPRTESSAAAAAYLAGLQAVRDASFVEAANAFERAASLDATMAAAHLRSALYGDWLIGTETRKHARAALALRASLSDDDRALLGAVEPLYLPPHPDVAEALSRVNALVAARRGDSELTFLSALLFVHQRPRAEAHAIAEHLLALDPRFASAAWLLAVVDQLAWDPQAIARDVDRCLAISPTAASCLRVRAVTEDLQGDCAGLEADAQRMVAMEEGSYRAYEFLSLALFARGRPLDSVRETLARKWAATPAPFREKVALLDEARLAVLRGDFAAAARSAEDLDREAGQDGTEKERAGAAALRIDIDDELGDLAAAARVADTYLNRADAWPATDSIDDDPRPRLYAVAARGGLRTGEERDRARDQWRALWSAQVQTLELPRIWVEGFAVPAETKEEARAALAILPAYAPIPPFFISGPTLWPLAKVRALAGAPDAAADLRRVTQSCHALAEPFAAVRAQLLLGEALEASDPKGACTAYASVLARWGSAKRSVTATAAAAHARALGCAGVK